MLPYIFLVSIPALLTLASQKFSIKDKKSNIVISSFFMLFIIFLSLRSENIGVDLSGYEYYYGTFHWAPWTKIFSISLEPAYSVLMKVTNDIGLNFQGFLALVAVISVGPVWYFYRKYAEGSFLAIALFIVVAPFTMYFSGLRQIIAMAFSYPAYHLAKNKRWILFSLTVLLAFLFHRSAFILLVLYPFCRFRVSVKWLWVFIPAIGLIFVFNQSIFVYLSALLSDWYSYNATETGAYSILILLLIFVVYSYMIPDEAQMDDDTAIMRNILLLCVVFQCFASVHSLAMRMNYYFLPFVPVLITRVANRSNGTNKNVAKLSSIIMSLFFVTYFFMTIDGSALEVYPYEFFWSTT